MLFNKIFVQPAIVHNNRKLFVYMFLDTVYDRECITGEPPHDINIKMTCAPSEDSDPLGHPPSLIIVFAIHMENSWIR